MNTSERQEHFDPDYWARVDTDPQTPYSTTTDVVEAPTPDFERSTAPESPETSVACSDCPFAGPVRDISVFGTSRVSDPLTSEGRLRVFFESEEGKSGVVTIGLRGNNYGTGDNITAAKLVVTAMTECSGPLEGPRYKALGICIGRTVTCGAFSVQSDPRNKPVRKGAVLGVTNANE